MRCLFYLALDERQQVAHGGASVDDVFHQQAMFALEGGHVDPAYL